MYTDSCVTLKLSIIYEHNVTEFKLSAPQFLSGHPSPPTLKVMPREEGHLLLLRLLFSFTSPLLLCVSYHCPARCNISVSDTKCNTLVNSCRLLLWAMLWGGKQNYRVLRLTAEAQKIFCPLRPFGLWNPPLTGISVPTPNGQRKHRYTCVTFYLLSLWSHG